MIKNIKLNKDMIINILIVISIISLLVLEIFTISFHNEVIVSNMINNIISQFLATVIFILIALGIKYNLKNVMQKVPFKMLILMVPALLVSINNFPFIAYISGNSELIQPVYTVYIYLLECFSTGFFEEVLFRGFILIILLKKLPKTKKSIFLSIFISSGIFSLMHMLNIFTGSSLPNTIVQIGYSLLMGLLWASVFIKTKNIFIPITLHAIYNFTGQVMFHLGTVNGRWDFITVVTTVILALFVIVYMFNLILITTPKEIKSLYAKKESTTI